MLAVTTAAAEGEPVSIWYRSSDGCPSGEEFVGRLAALGRGARLAGAGDRIDFVVTLGANAQTSAGRLERQTTSGTVAIREVEAESCQQVSEALALSLDLALGPRASDGHPRAAPGETVASEARAPTAETNATGSQQQAAPPPPATSPAPPPSESTGKPSTPALASPPDRPTPPRAVGGASNDTGPGFGLGLESTLATGVAPNPMLGLGVFGEARLSTYDSPGARLHLGVSVGQRDRLEFMLARARFEGCVPLVGSHAFRIAPCLHLDLGALEASYSAGGGGSDRGLWSSAGAGVLAGFRLGSSIALEAQLGGDFPFKRYETVANDDETLFRTRSLGFFAGLGVIWLPE